MKTDNSQLNLVVVIPVARMDWHLAVHMLTWWKRLLGDAFNPTPVVALCSPDLTPEQRAQLALTAVPYLSVVTAKDIAECGYFGSANQMFKAALLHVEEHYTGRAMLWVEADCVPMHKLWVEDIANEYRECGQPFMGDHVISAINHMTGNAVYHPEWRKFAPSLAALPGPVMAWGWDSQCAHETFPQSHPSDTIRQHWRPPLPITKAWRDQNITLRTALMHQCKDGSLIDLLCEEKSWLKTPLAPALCESTYESDKAKHGSAHAQGMPPRVKLNPAVDILIVTFKRDMEFLRYCLAAITKFATGFQGVCIVVPESERGLYDWVTTARIEYFDEPPGKGMLAHEAQIMRADEICPDADYILHLDPDCVFWEPVRPSDYIVNGRVVKPREEYSKIGNMNRHLWRECVENAIGVKPEHDFMLCHPNIHKREVYQKARNMIEARCARSCESFILKGRNEFPQTFAEFPTLGTVAWKFFADYYEFTDYDRDLDKRECSIDHDGFQYVYRAGRDKLVETWSHGGIERYRGLLDSIMSNQRPQFVLK